MKYMLLIYTAPGGDTEPQCTFEDWQQYDKEMKDLRHLGVRRCPRRSDDYDDGSGLAVRRKDRH